MTVSTHVYTATVDTHTLSIKGGELSLDTARVPHVQGTLTLTLPDEVVLDALDPRQSPPPRVVVTATDWTTTREFDLTVRELTADHKTATATVQLSSDEALLTDYAPVLEDSARQFEASIRAVVDYVIGTAIPGAGIEVFPDVDADVTAAWALTNLVLNPRCASTTGYFLGTNASTLGVGSSSPWIGSGYVRWVGTAAGPSFLGVSVSDTRVTPGQTYTFIAHVRASSAAQQGRLYLQYKDSAGTVVGSGALSPLFTLATGTGWSEIDLTATIPEGVVSAQPYVIGQGAAGITYALDGVMYYQDDEFVLFFSGASTDPHYTFAWVGTADASPSVRTPVVERPPEMFVWRAGVSAMEFLHPILQSQGLRLVCDEQRRWTLRDENYEAPGTVSLRAGVNLVEASGRISRDGDLWFDARATRYRWTDRQGKQQERVDSYALPGHSRTSLVDVYAPYPGPGRSEYAVRRAQGVGREVTATKVSDWAVTTEQGVEVILPDPPVLIGRVRSLRYDLATDEMTITTRTTEIPDGAIDLLVGTINALTGTINAL